MKTTNVAYRHKVTLTLALTLALAGVRWDSSPRRPRGHSWRVRHGRPHRPPAPRAARARYGLRHWQLCVHGGATRAHDGVLRRQRLHARAVVCWVFISPSHHPTIPPSHHPSGPPNTPPPHHLTTSPSHHRTAPPAKRNWRHCRLPIPPASCRASYRTFRWTVSWR